jgi:hypothetical protein
LAPDSLWNVSYFAIWPAAYLDRTEASLGGGREFNMTLASALLRMSGISRSHPRGVTLPDAALEAHAGEAVGPTVGRGIDGKLITTVVVLLVMLGLLEALAPSFFRLNNLVNILVQTSTPAILAIGMSFVMIGGGIDLSMPANMALSAVLGALSLP